MKDALTWRPAYSVHIEVIDAQHQVLFSMLADMRSALERGQGSMAAARILPQLIAYTQYHFGEEERLMEKYDYPARAEHKLQHDILTRRVMLFQKSHQEGGSVIPMSLLVFLQEWLKTHILGSDTQFGEFVLQQKVPAAPAVG